MGAVVELITPHFGTTNNSSECGAYGFMYWNLEYAIDVYDWNTDDNHIMSGAMQIGYKSSSGSKMGQIW